MKPLFTEEEFDLFKQLKTKENPPQNLEDRVIQTLYDEQLLTPPPSMLSSSKVWIVLTSFIIIVSTSILLFTSVNNADDIYGLLEDCEQIQGLELVSGPGQILILGELHGTKEVPDFVKKVICNILKSGQVLTVCLELPRDEQDLVNAYLSSKGHPSDRRKLLSAHTWSRAYQDGRNSQAMFDLIEHCRKLIQNGAPLKVLMIDDPSSPDRDYAMAQNILVDFNSHPKEFYVALVGNYHNRISKGSGSMADVLNYYMEDSQLYSLDQLYGSGTAWACLAMEGCGIHALSGRDGNARGIILEPVDDSADYHGYYGVGPINGSLPAREVYILK